MSSDAASSRAPGSRSPSASSPRATAARTCPASCVNSGSGEAGSTRKSMSSILVVRGQLEQADGLRCRSPGRRSRRRTGRRRAAAGSCAGTPTAIAPAGTSWMTTAFAPICAPLPIQTGPRILAPAPDDDAVAERRVPLAVAHRLAAERRAVEQHHVVADLGGLADDDAHAVVDEQPPAEPGAGVDLDAGDRPRELGDQPRGQPQAGLVPHPVRQPVHPDRVHARVAEGDLGERPGRGVAVPGGLEVLPEGREEVQVVRTSVPSSCAVGGGRAAERAPCRTVSRAGPRRARSTGSARRTTG